MSEQWDRLKRAERLNYKKKDKFKVKSDSKKHKDIEVAEKRKKKYKKYTEVDEDDIPWNIFND